MGDCIEALAKHSNFVVWLSAIKHLETEMRAHYVVRVPHHFFNENDAPKKLEARKKEWLEIIKSCFKDFKEKDLVSEAEKCIKSIREIKSPDLIYRALKITE